MSKEAIRALLRGDNVFAPRKAGGPTGMTLRDWFAGQALMGLVAFDRLDAAGDNKPEHFARWSYAIADAMLAAREPTT
jgi:hypothetical protein